MSSGSCSSRNVERDRKRGGQPFGLTPESCRCGEEGRRCCSEVRFGIIMWSSGSERRDSVGTEWERVVIHLKGEDLKGQEREGRGVEKADD